MLESTLKLAVTVAPVFNFGARQCPKIMQTASWSRTNYLATSLTVFVPDVATIHPDKALQPFWMPMVKASTSPQGELS